MADSSTSAGKGWLELYLEYTEQSEAPEVFHTWVGMSIISAVLRRKLWINQGYHRLFPNLYVVLVSPPGKCRKTSAINAGAAILREVDGITIESNKLTTSALIETLGGSGLQAATKMRKQDDDDAPAETDPDAALNGIPSASAGHSKIVLYRECTAVLISTEFSVMLGHEAHQTGLIALLTDLYDCPEEWIYKTRSRGKEILDNVYLSLLAASTPDWLGQTIPANAIGGGFTSRMIFVVQKERRQDNPRPRLGKRELALRKELAIRLNRINDLKGEVTLSADAEAYYDHWYRNERIPPVIDDRFAGYFERKQDHLLKLAIIQSVAEDDSLVIRRHHLLKALDCFDLIEHAMPEAFAGLGVATTAYIPKLMDQIRAAGGELDYAELVRRNFQMVTIIDMQILLDTMYAAGLAKEVVKNNGRFIQLK